MFKAAIKVPISTAANAVTTRVITDNPITTIQGATSETSTKTVGGSMIIEETVDIQATMTLELSETGESDFVINRELLYSDRDTATLTADQIATGYIIDGTHAIGAGTTNTTLSIWEETNPIILYNGDRTYTYKWRVTAANNDMYIIINRQPRFNPSGTFVTWDSFYSGDSAFAKSHNNAGTKITTDWDNISSLEGFSLGSEDVPGIVVTTSGSEDGPWDSDTTSLQSNTFVDIQVTVTGSFGTGDINPELRLKNFLTVFTLP